MIRRSLSISQAKLLAIIEQLGFGRIERLSIQNGQPCFERPPRIVQEVKLDSQSESHPDDADGDLTLKKEFVSLFSELSRLRDGLVDIEVRHSAPFRLVRERCHSELVQQGTRARLTQ